VCVWKHQVKSKSPWSVIHSGGGSTRNGHACGTTLCVAEHIVFFTCDSFANMTCLVYVSDHCSRVVVSNHCRAVVDGIKSLTWLVSHPTLLFPWQPIICCGFKTPVILRGLAFCCSPYRSALVKPQQWCVVGYIGIGFLEAHYSL